MWFSFIISSFETLYIYKRENQCFLEHWDLWCPRCLRSKGLFQSSSYWLSTAFHPTATPSLNCSFLWLCRVVFLPTFCLLCPAAHPQGSAAMLLSSSLSLSVLPFPSHLFSLHAFFSKSSRLCPYLSSVTCTMLLIPKSKPSACAFSLKTRPRIQTSPFVSRACPCLSVKSSSTSPLPTQVSKREIPPRYPDCTSLWLTLSSLLRHLLISSSKSFTSPWEHLSQHSRLRQQNLPYGLQ